MGGIGNQLFQYAVGRQLSADLKCPLEINLDWFERETYRQSIFGEFEHLGTLAPSTRWRRNVENLSVWTRSHLGYGPGKSVDTALRIYREKPRQFDPNVLQQSVGISLRGYFQSPKYFDGIEEQVRAEVADLSKPSTQFRLLHSELSQDGTWASLHVRLGDYREPENVRQFGLLNRRYYEQALQLVLESTSIERILLFSDQPEHARHLLPVDFPIEVLPNIERLSDFEALLLMSLANAVIMANSTFSWWAAFLGNKPCRLVIAPRPWFLSVDRSDLLLPNWISIGR